MAEAGAAEGRSGWVTEDGGGWVARLAHTADRIACSPVFAYGSLALIQAKVMWGMWQFKDLSAGDEQYYFILSSNWADHLTLSLPWYPVYQLYFGSLKWLVPDAYGVTIVHRLLIVFALTLLVLAIMRRLLPPGIAWLLAVWWAVLPVNFDSVYEVHMFAAVPVFAAVLLALTRSGLWVRATVFGIFFGDAVLLRNEAITTALVFGAIWIGYELWLHRRGRGVSLRRVAAAAGAAVGVVVVLTAAVLATYPNGPNYSSLSDEYREKHVVNTCLIYAVGYTQRNDDFTESPWLHCADLMRRDFGEPMPTMTEAIRANPAAMAEHFLWNIRLIPDGLQLMLFNGTSGTTDTNPDYLPITTGSKAVLVASLGLLVFVLVGGTMLWRDRHRWWRERIRDRAWGWVALGATSVTAVLVMIMQRPRPSYLFDLRLLLLALIGCCAVAFVDRWPFLGRMRALIPALAAALVIAWPSYYDGDYVSAFSAENRPLKTMVDHLEPYTTELERPGSRLLGTRAVSACAYLGEDRPCDQASIQTAVPELPRDPPTLRGQLAAERVNYIYAGEDDLSAPGVPKLIEVLQRMGWVRIAPPTQDQGWVLLRD